ncbi:MAG: sodium:proline symporter [Burkholderiaceae bacterium]
MKNLASVGLRPSYAGGISSRSRIAAWLVAALAAGMLSTVVQVLLWVLFTDQWPAILFRDARLAAALLMGPSELPPPASFDITVMAVASVVHFALSLVYAGLVALLVERQPSGRVVVLGAAFGLVLYLVNMHGFTWIFPWFAQSRDLIAVVAHLAFGVFAAVAYRRAAHWRLA